jgi:hypothetical protein
MEKVAVKRYLVDFLLPVSFTIHTCPAEGKELAA